MSTDSTQRAVIFVRGRVQGVGFRWWTRSQALQRGVVGYARNLTDGRVEICAQGTTSDVGELVALLDPQSPPAGRPGWVSGVSVGWYPPREDLHGFVER